jgi:hypothetical protein
MLLEARQDDSRRPDGELLAGDLEDERAEGIEPRELVDPRARAEAIVNTLNNRVLIVDPRARAEVWMRVDQARESRIGVRGNSRAVGSATVAVIPSAVDR